MISVSRLTRDLSTMTSKAEFYAWRSQRRPWRDLMFGLIVQRRRGTLPLAVRSNECEWTSPVPIRCPGTKIDGVRKSI